MIPVDVHDCAPTLHGNNLAQATGNGFASGHLVLHLPCSQQSVLLINHSKIIHELIRPDDKCGERPAPSHLSALTLYVSTRSSSCSATPALCDRALLGCAAASDSTFCCCNRLRARKQVALISPPHHQMRWSIVRRWVMEARSAGTEA
jgi:hypothetical protein